MHRLAVADKIVPPIRTRSELILLAGFRFLCAFDSMFITLTEMRAADCAFVRLLLCSFHFHFFSFHFISITITFTANSTQPSHCSCLPDKNEILFEKTNERNQTTFNLFRCKSNTSKNESRTDLKCDIEISVLSHPQGWTRLANVFQCDIEISCLCL